MGLKQKNKKACKSAPAWAFGPHGPCILRFSSRLDIESDRDKIELDCFPSLRTINMYPMLFMNEERHHVSQTTTLGASPPLILGFHPSKRRAALIAPRDQERSGQRCSCFYLGITRTKAFLMTSNASYLDVHSMALADLLCFVAYHLRIACCLCAVTFSILC